MKSRPEGYPGSFGPLVFVGARNGDTLSKSPQPVPGGLLGVTAPTWWPQILQNLFNETINNGFTGVNATVELAAPASAIKFSLLNIALAGHRNDLTAAAEQAH